MQTFRSGKRMLERMIGEKAGTEKAVAEKRKTPKMVIATPRREREVGVCLRISMLSKVVDAGSESFQRSVVVEPSVE